MAAFAQYIYSQPQDHVWGSHVLQLLKYLTIKWARAAHLTRHWDMQLAETLQMPPPSPAYIHSL